MKPEISSFFATQSCRCKVLAFSLLLGSNAQAATVFINEFHYDNNGSDVDEGVEIAGRSGQSLEGWSLLFYNGSNGSVYKTEELGGTFGEQQNGFGTLNFFIANLQNGPNDAIALVDNNQSVVEFLSYEGPLLANEGAAAGMTSIDVGVEEPADLTAGFSIQRIGSGVDSEDFSWTLDVASFGSINSGQQLNAVPLPASALLYGCALAGFAAARRKRKDG